jgi:hypothetical protein
VFTPRVFGRHWRNLMDGFIAEAETLGALLVRYEDLIADSTTVERVEAYLGITIDHTILRKKVRNSGNVKDNPAEKRPEVKVSGLETWLLRRAVAPTAAQLGYRF